MNRQIIKQFSSQIGKELRCFPATKRTLLQGLEAELNELPDEATASMEALKNRIGDTSLIVNELQSSVSLEEEQCAIKRRRKKTRLVMGGIITISLIAFLIGAFLFFNGPFFTVETITEF